jgi:hypothetical protein
MRDNIPFAEEQTVTNPSSTGEITDNIHDLEKNSAAAALITDDQVEAVCNVVIRSVAFGSGGTEGVVFEVRTDDATNLATGEIVVGAVHIPLAEVVAGAKISIPFLRNVMKRYVGGWLRAHTTTYTGDIVFDQYIDFAPIGPNETIQKVPA